MLTFEMMEVEYLNEKGKPTESQGWRAKIPGGWLVGFTGSSNFFVPDPEHRWDGSSLP